MELAVNSTDELHNAAEQLIRLIRAQAKNPDFPAGWPDQAGHQIHERGFAGAVRTNQAGDAGRDGEVDPVHAQHFAVEFGYVVAENLLLHGGHAHFTTS